MSTIKSYTDIFQSKKLTEILPLESADMWWVALNWQETEYYAEVKQDGINQPKKAIPCWSLVALLGVLPDELEDNHFLTLNKGGNEYCCCYEDINGDSFRHTFAGNPVDTCYEMILKLHELNLL